MAKALVGRTVLSDVTKSELTGYIKRCIHDGEAVSYHKYLEYFGKQGEHPVSTNTLTRYSKMIHRESGKPEIKNTPVRNLTSITEKRMYAPRKTAKIYRTIYESETKEMDFLKMKEIITSFHEHGNYPKLEIVSLETGFEIREVK